MTTGASRCGGDPLRGRDAVQHGHLHVEDGEFGLQGGHAFDRRLTVPDLGHDGVALFLQHFLQVQADQRLILGDNDSKLLLAHADERTGSG